MNLEQLSFDLPSLRRAYLAGQVTPAQVVAEALRRIGADPQHAWIELADADALHAQAQALAARHPQDLPLYGLPFAVKDNIDVAGLPTTAACPAFAYTPTEHAHVVQRLVDAGALVIGKTNLDQFATGLNGTRSPYGVCHNSVDPAYVSGGSSSGSAVAVALGQVSFALGTDTAGSGRVPAAFNHIVGLKPTTGLLSARGMLPACKSLDTVSIFALTADDAHRVFSVALHFDPADPYARPAQPHGCDWSGAASFKLGVPRADQRVFAGDAHYEAAYTQAIEHARALGADIVEFDFTPFLEAAQLLYGGPWVAERYLAIRGFIDAHAAEMLPVTREITQGGARMLAADAFAAQYRLRALKRMCDALWQQVDAVLLPSAPTHPTIEQMLAQPVALNTLLGTYTNFMNLLDYAAVAVPAGWTERGLPFGVTLFAPAHQDVPLLNLAQRWHQALATQAGAERMAQLGATAATWTAMQAAQAELAQAPPRAVPSGQVRVAVCGAHLEGQPLNHQLTSRGARLVARTQSAPVYRLYALAGGPLPRPAMMRVGPGESGSAIEVEVWELPATTFGSFVAAIAPPLGIGATLLADGSSVPGFICEAAGLAGAQDITALGGWRAYLASR